MDRIIHQESERQRYEHLMDGLAGFPKSQTVASFISHMGWKMFGIFAHSEAFRSAADEFDIGKWKLLMVQIAQNAFSLEMFARLRCLEWRGLFLKHTIAAPKSLLQALGPESRLPVTHHHHFVLSSNGKWHEPTSADHLQEHTEHSIVNSRAWPDASVKVRDPSIRRRLNGNCDVCGYETRCDCVLRSLAGSLIELVPSSVRGTGVRALTNFQAGDILDQYVGELCPPSFPGDAIYGLVLESKEAQGMSKTRAVLSPKRYGNWLRFLEHSCDASVRFHCRTVGDRIILTAEANRDIGFGEEITVDYGHAYWRDKNCCCGEEKCYSNPMSQERVK